MAGNKQNSTEKAMKKKIVNSLGKNGLLPLKKDAMETTLKHSCSAGKQHNQSGMTALYSKEL